MKYWVDILFLLIAIGLIILMLSSCSGVRVVGTCTVKEDIHTEMTCKEGGKAVIVQPPPIP